MSADKRSPWHLMELIKRWRRRPPDFIIGGAENPYMLRWYIIPRNPWFNVYLHHFLRSDDDRALHDHPWLSLGIILRGKYLEHMLGQSVIRRPFVPVLRKATHRHRVELIHGEVWTLFITGPKIREWGFWCPKGFRHWRDFTAPTDYRNIGKGCDG